MTLRIWTTLPRATASRPVRARSDVCCAAKYPRTAAMRVNILKRIISPLTKPQFALSVINLSGQSTAWPPICLKITEDLGQLYRWYNSRCSVSFTILIIVYFYNLQTTKLKPRQMTDKILIFITWNIHFFCTDTTAHCTALSVFFDLLWSHLFQK